jgi:hypothetical protein
MQLRNDANQQILADAFAEPAKSEIVVETPKIITSSIENIPTKLVL